jgi:hypothetical protein
MMVGAPRRTRACIWLAAALLCGEPANVVLAGGSPSPYQPPWQAAYKASERQADQERVRGWWQREKFIHKCVRSLH